MFNFPATTSPFIVPNSTAALSTASSAASPSMTFNTSSTSSRQEQQQQFNNLPNLDEKLSFMISAIINSRSLMNQMISKQDTLATTVNTLVTEVNKVKADVATHTTQIQTIESSLVEVNANLNALSSSQHTISNADLIVATVPASVTSADHPQLLNSIFTRLNIPHLAQHIIRARTMKKPDVGAVGGQPSAAALENSSQSLLVQMTSTQVRDAVIDAKRQVKRVKLSEVMRLTPGMTDVDVSVNEFFHRTVLQLLHAARAKVRELRRGRAWRKSGTVYAKANDRNRPIMISSVADLQRLN